MRLVSRQQRGVCLAAVLLLVFTSVTPALASDEAPSTPAVAEGASASAAAPLPAAGDPLPAAGNPLPAAAASLPAIAAPGQTGALPAAVAPPVSRISASDPLNGGFLIVNMHGMLF